MDKDEKKVEVTDENISTTPQEIKSSSNESSSNNNALPQKKKFNFTKLVLVIASVFVVLVVIGTILINTGMLIRGKWECSYDIVLEINKDHKFKMYNDDDRLNNYVEGTYKIARKYTTSDSYIKYEVDFNSSSRKIDGVYYSDPSSNRYELSIKSTKQREMTLYDKKTYKTYNCDKVR